MENQEKVRKPCPRPKKKNKTRKKNPKKNPHTYQCMFIVDQTVLPNDQSGHVSQCFSREPGICVCGLQGEREREENDRILECAVLLLDESCWSNVAHTVCRWKKNQLQPQLGNDPLWSADRNRVWQTEEDPWRVAWFRPTKEVKWSDVKGWVCTCNMIYQAM